jgi:hypothetical protein
MCYFLKIGVKGKMQNSSSMIPEGNGNVKSEGGVCKKRDLLA